MKDTFISWVNEDQAGLPIWGWLVIGVVVLILSCFGLCYKANGANSSMRKSNKLPPGKKERDTESTA